MSCKRGHITLAFCEGCSFITNVRFVPEHMNYDSTYENALHHSPRYQKYALECANELVERYQLIDKDIIEIGSGSGEFLILLSQLGKNRGLGFDPGHVPESLPKDVEGRVNFVRDYFSPLYENLRADMICCRQTLEHLQNPMELLQTIYKTCGNGKDGRVFFEVPNAGYMLEKPAIWDLIYEHCSYFTPDSLRVAFNQSGFMVDDIVEVFERQYLTLYGRSGGASPSREYRVSSERMEGIGHLITRFASTFKHIVNGWQAKLKRMGETHDRVVAWGAGSKGVSFCNLMGDMSPIEFVVDVNPLKFERFIAGSGQQIMAPAFLTEYRPDIVIVMNPIYQDEIKMNLETLGLSPKIICVTESENQFIEEYR